MCAIYQEQECINSPNNAFKKMAFSMSSCRRKFFIDLISCNIWSISDRNRNPNQIAYYTQLIGHSFRTKNSTKKVQQSTMIHIFSVHFFEEGFDQPYSRQIQQKNQILLIEVKHITFDQYTLYIMFDSTAYNLIVVVVIRHHIVCSLFYTHMQRGPIIIEQRWISDQNRNTNKQAYYIQFGYFYDIKVAQLYYIIALSALWIF